MYMFSRIFIKKVYIATLSLKIYYEYIHQVKCVPSLNGTKPIDKNTWFPKSATLKVGLIDNCRAYTELNISF